MLAVKNYKFWFCTGSQDLYGDEQRPDRKKDGNGFDGTAASGAYDL